MSDKSKERVKAIAKSLKELDLAVSMDDALARAREIVKSAQGEGVAVKQLLRDIKDEASVKGSLAKSVSRESDKNRRKFSSEAKSENSLTKRNLKSAKVSKSKAKAVKEGVTFDIRVHKLEKGDTAEAMRKAEEVKCAVDDARFIVDEADKVQKSKKKKK